MTTHINHAARTNRLVVGGILGLIGAALVAGGGTMGGAFVLFLAVGLVASGELADRRRDQRIAQQNNDARQVEGILRDDFSALDIITPDVRWLGSEAQLVCFRYPFRAEHGFTQHILGRSNKGRWFVVEYDMDWLTITARRVYASDETTAKSWLAYDRDTYIKFFGIPETA